MKKYTARLLPLILILVFALVVSVGVTAFVRSETDEPTLSPRNYDEDGTHTESAAKNGGINFASGDPSLLKHGKVYNIVIFICFSDENPSRMFPSSTVEEIDRSLNGDNSSMKNYYESLSYGSFSVESKFVYNNTGYFVYRDSEPRSRYGEVTSEDGTVRYDPESQLLNRAVAAADEYFSLSPDEIDLNGDGYVDSVSFIVSGEYDKKAWGHLLWPHSWNLDRISKITSTSVSQKTSSALAGVKVDTYTLTFANKFEVGLVAHEFGHVVGLPDLYHYYDSESKEKFGYPKDNRSYLPVGQWDLMHQNNVVPQFTLSYLRDSYLGFLDKKQVVELTTGGTYTLKPTSSSSKNDVVAYKITINSKESIWLEYRNNSESVSPYDSGLPSSGLIVYRINNSVSGNTEAKIESSSYPDEVFVFRPNAAASTSISSTSEKEQYNLARAALNTEEGGYSSLGSKTANKYSPSAIYTSDGVNTGIVVSVSEMDNKSLTFTVDLARFDGNDISDSFVMGKKLDGTSVKNEHYAYFGETIDVSVYLKYSSRPNAPVELTDYELRYEEKVCPEGQTAYVVFSDKSGERTIPFTLYIYDSLKFEATVLTKPTKTKISAGETLSLSGLSIKIQYSSGREEIVKYDESDPSDFVIKEGFDNTVHGKYDHILVCYKKSVYFTLKGIEVVSPIKSIAVSDTDTQRLFGSAFVPKFNVIGTFNDGSKRTLEESEFTYTVPSGAPGDKAIITLVAVSAPEVKTQTEVYCTGDLTVSDVKITTYPKSYLGSKNDYIPVDYGYEPDFSGGVLTVTFGDGSFVTADMDSYRSLLLSSYSPTKTGLQTLRATIGTGARFSFSVKINVLPKSSSLISIVKGSPCETTIKINETEKKIIVSSPTPLSFLSSSLNSYALKAVFFDTEEEYELSLNAFSSRAVGNNMTLKLTTDGGITVAEYSIYLLGDADGDGFITDADKTEWMNALLSENSRISHFDANGDGTYTLSDFVALLRKYKGERE